MSAAKLAILLLFVTAPVSGQEISNKELGRSALETALSHIKSGDPEIRAMAADVLGKTGNKSAAGVLQKLLSDPDKQVRLSAAEALWNLGTQSGLKVVYAVINDAPVETGEDDSPLAELKVISRNKVRARAIETLVRMRGDKAEKTLLGLKNESFGAIRDTAARELARLGYSDELEQFLEAVESEDEAIKFEGVNILAKICNSAAVDPLKALLTARQSMRVRIAALDALRCMDGRISALPELLALADDLNPTLKFKAVSVLSAINDKRSFAKLMEISADTNDISLKIAALKGLMAGGEKPDLEILTRAFASDDQDVKLAALNALENMNDLDAKRYLRTALNDAGVPVKLAASLQVLKRFAKNKRKPAVKNGGG